MIRTKSVLIFLLGVLATGGHAEATSYASLGLHERVQLSDTIVLGRIANSARAIVDVERVLKGAAPKQITLVEYVDGFAIPAQQKLLVSGVRELLFLRRKGDSYAPVQDQYGRMAVDGDRLIDSFRQEPRSVSQTLTSIQRLVVLQTRAARGDSEADRAYVEAFADPDREVQTWALATSFHRLKVPSTALADAVLAHWRRDTGPVPQTWPHDAGLVANAVVTWRLRRSAPMFAESLKTSTDGERRAFAAMALGGAGDVTYLRLLREVASRDPHVNARAAAYGGIVDMLGPAALEDLRRGAKDSNERVRASITSDAYNMLELEQPERRWPPASNAHIEEVRAFLSEMERDPAVRDSAKYMLALIAGHRR
jgi:hypothetical protein